MNYDRPQCPNSDAIKHEHRGCEPKTIGGRDAMVCSLCNKIVFLK